MLNVIDQQIQTIFQNNNDGFSTDDIVSIIIKLLVIYFIYVTLKFILNRLIYFSFKNRFVNNYRRSPQRLMTLNRAVKNGVNYALYFFLAYNILNILGFPIGTLVAGAGIASVAFGMGAKEFVTDVINGLFIIIERQFDVGEYVELPAKNIRGYIKELGIRSTKIRATNGHLYTIPNREITIVNNQSREDITVKIELPIPPEIPIHLFPMIIENETQIIYEKLEDQLIKEPLIIGITKSDNQQFLYQVNFYVTNGTQYKMTSLLYEHYLICIERNKSQYRT